MVFYINIIIKTRFTLSRHYVLCISEKAPTYNPQQKYYIKLYPNSEQNVYKILE